MYTALALATVLWPVTVSEYCAPPMDALIVGVALNSRREFLYCEYFSQTSQHHFTVKYVQDKIIFASKTLDYSINPYIPNINQIDQRTGEQRESQLEQSKVRLSYQPATGKRIETASLEEDEVDVVDAGFDNFVKTHWQRLIAGETLAINFGSIAHLKSLPLRIKSLPAIKCGPQKNAPPTQYCFSVDIDNSLLRLLLKDIKLSYDEGKRLVQFSGVVNLQDNLQKSQSATINYFYRQDYLNEIPKP